MADLHRLEITDLTVAYRRVPAVHHLSVTLESGHCVGLIGPNGAGKTTLLKAIAGLVQHETGKISMHGHQCCGREAGIAYLPQRENVDWDFPLTVRGLVEMGRFAAIGGWKKFGPKDEKAVNDALAVMHLDELAGRQINALSGGQQQRAFLARSWAQEAHVYLLDEPFNGLDKNAQEDLAAVLKWIANAGRLIIASHHNLKTVPDIFDQVILLNGELVAFGSVQDTFTPELIDRTFSTSIMTEHYHHH